MKAGAAPAVDPGRGDWRRLLPSHGRREHLVVLGAPPGLADRLAFDGEAARVSEHLPAGGVVDGLALLADGKVDLSAASRVGPGGAVYVEVVRTRGANAALTPRCLERRLAQHGLRVLDAYAVVPGFHVPRAWLPLACPAALAWYADTLQVPWRARHVPPLLVTRLAARAGAWTRGLLTKRFALTGMRGDVAASSAALRACDAVAGVENAAAVLLLRGGWHRTVALPFAEGAEKPLAVVKIPDRRDVVEFTRYERALLLELRSLVGGRLRTTLPEPLGTGDLDGIPVCAESLLPGRPIARSTGSLAARPSVRRADLHAAAAWLGEFHVQTREAERRWTKADVETWMEEPWSRMLEREPAGDGLGQLRDASLRAASGLAGRPFAGVLQHRDFTPWNVVRGPEGVGVVDWEGGRRGLPLADLLHFATHWAEQDARQVPGTAPGDTMRRVLGRSDDRTSRTIVDAVRAYLQRIGLDAGFVPVLLVHTWLELATRHRTPRSERVAGDATSMNPNLPYLRALADDAALLFDD